VNIKFILKFITQRRGDAKNAERIKGIRRIKKSLLTSASSAALRLCVRSSENNSSCERLL